MLHGVVRMGSKVVYRDETTGLQRAVALVYPHEADIGLGRISVLTAVGAALIGLSVGQSIEFETPSGTLPVLERPSGREPRTSGLMLPTYRSGEFSWRSGAHAARARQRGPIPTRR